MTAKTLFSGAVNRLGTRGLQAKSEGEGRIGAAPATPRFRVGFGGGTL